MKDYINKRIEGRNAILESSSIVMEFFGKNKKDKPKKFTTKKFDDKEVKSKIKALQSDIKKVIKDYDLPDLRLCGDADLYGNYDPKQEYFESTDDFNIVRCSVYNDKHEKELNKLVKDIRNMVKKYNIFVVGKEYDKDEAFIYVDLKFANEL